MNFNIAIDGPAGSGKSTIANLLANKYDLMYINTGAMYRAVTLFAKENNIRPEDTEKLSKLINDLQMHFEKEKLIVNGEYVNDRITMPEISNSVSDYAKVQVVRELLVKAQKKLGKEYNVIMDGRDIGTNVLTDAKYKFFLTANPEERAKRRYLELTSKGIEVNYEDILNDIIKRDLIDSTREISPLKKADDAIEIDTSKLNIDDVVNYICEYIE
ncbi:Cytidylate kinase [Clostridium bornimense]|uniref:Cytidylate kinase n=1 Tax=Clostridium bornimense TaxID=1216932 RepID=W6S238_9CLOT|nr:(d)CMP kinase [Clostridium bornimense]CDM68377.1 Cytidylate kinase [Clostridium bornimense]